MATSAAGEASTPEDWGTVRRGFAVWLADGRRGSVAEIRRPCSGRVELRVVTGLFFRTHVTVLPAEIEVILPELRRIIIGEAHGGGHQPAMDGDVQTPGAVTPSRTEQLASTPLGEGPA